MYSTVGGFIVTWTYTDGNGNTSTQTQSVTIIDCSGIEEVDAFEMDIFPNPSNGIFTLSFAELPSGQTSVKLMDAIGKVIYSNDIMNQMTQYDFSYLKAGTYYLQVVNGNKSVTKTIIITQQY